MKIKDGVYGLVVADALGVPVEFETREYLKENPVEEMLGYGTYNQPPGTFSDDSSMTLATMDALSQSIETIDYERIMEAFSRWLTNGEYTPYGETFDVGNTTHNAISNYIRGEEALNCGEDYERANGNGSLMRILPIAYYINELYHNAEKEVIYEIIENLSSLTHAHPISRIACVFYVEFVISMLNKDKDFEYHLDYAIDNIKRYYKNNSYLEKFNRILTKKIIDLPESEISSSGFVLSTLEAVIWCLFNSESYKESVLKAVNLGRDTDTVGAICGAAAGIYYGFENIPKEWIEEITGTELVDDLCYDFEVAIHNQQITNICQFTDYFKQADETSYEIISGNVTEPFGHVEYDKEMYMFYNVLIKNNYLVNIRKEYSEEIIETATSSDIKEVLTDIIKREQSCKNSYRRAIKEKKFYKILTRLNELRR